MNDWITEQLALAEKATEGPWDQWAGTASANFFAQVFGGEVTDPILYPLVSSSVEVDGFPLPGQWTVTTLAPEDQSFIASARLGYPAALRMLRVAVKALEYYQTGENWYRNSRLDGNGRNFDGGPAKEALAEIKEIGGAQ